MPRESPARHFLARYHVVERADDRHANGLFLKERGHALARHQATARPGPSAEKRLVRIMRSVTSAVSAGLRRAVFFDRDGTLMEEVHYCNDPGRVRALPGAREMLRQVRRSGWLTIIVTNQSGIGTGRITLAQYHEVQAELLRQLDSQIDATYFCPDPPASATARRKPGIGMLEEAARDFTIDLAGSFFVGDREIDIECGHRAGMRSILVLTGYGKEHVACGADFTVASVAEITPIVLALNVD